MPGYVYAVDVVGLMLAALGFTMAFRQQFIRKLIGRPKPSASQIQGDAADDPLTYVLRISGTMIMVFGIVTAGMLTLFHLAQAS